MQAFLAIVFGALLGGWMGRDGAAVFGALIGWLLLRSWRQQRELAALKQALGQSPAPAATPAVAPVTGTDGAPTTASPTPTLAADLAGATPAARTALDLPGAATVTPGAIATLPAEALPAAVPDERSQAGQPAAAASALGSAFDPPGMAVPQPAEPAVPKPPGPLDALRQWFFGGNTIVKAGVGILFIGLAFLAKYASEHVQVPIEFRLAGIAAVAVVLLGLGWRLRHQRPGYAQVLQGGAVAVLYLTLFVAFKFYGVLAVGPVFAMMVVVAALAAALAVLQNAPSLAVIGALGGFATPLLVSTGSGNQVALFSYYLVLDLGIAAIAWFRTWRVLNLVGFLFTFVVGSAWGVLKYEPQHYASSQGFLIAFFLLFVLVLLLPARRAAVGTEALADGRGAAWVNGSLLFGLPTVGFALQYGLVRHTEYGVALSALVLAGFYVLMASWMRHRPRLALTFEASLAIGTVFLTLVIPFALDARSTAGAWSLEGAGLVWLGLRQQRRLPRAFGYALLLLAGGAMLFGHSQGVVISSPWNATLFNALMAAAASLAAACFVQRHALDGERVAEPLLIGWATLWLLWGAAVQIDALVSAQRAPAAWIGVLSAMALLYTLLGHRLVWPRVTLPVLGHMPLMLLAALLNPLWQDHPLHHGGAWAWPLALLAQALVLHWAAPAWPAGGSRLVHALGALLVAVLGALLGRSVTGDWSEGHSAWPWLGWLAVPALLLFVLPTARLAGAWPLRLDPLAYQRHAAGVLALGGLLWALLANLVSSGVARPLPYVPLVNPLDLGIAAALVAAGFWWRSAGAEPLARRQPSLGPVLLGGLGFLWLNGMLVRCFHHWGGVPYRFDDWVGSQPVQTGLTLLWTVIALALMWGSARRAARTPWITGAVLLGVVVLKLLLVDQSGSGTVARIVSFIGVGVLMLVIGYVAPLPAAKAGELEHVK